MSDSADVVGRLCRDFSPLLPEVVIVEVVSQCRWELSGVPAAAMPEMLERLARHRLDFLDTSTAWLS
ncbi:MAG TPA: hypothetical protein VGH11_17000 [Jatrophihabitans sp.]